MSLVNQPVWKGTAAEAQALAVALRNNCHCVFAPDGARRKTCPGCDALLHEQRFLDALLFARRIVLRLRAEEWMVWGPPE
jgi:hypothetical protein